MQGTNPTDGKNVIRRICGILLLVCGMAGVWGCTADVEGNDAVVRAANATTQNAANIDAIAKEISTIAPITTPITTEISQISAVIAALAGGTILIDRQFGSGKTLKNNAAIAAGKTPVAGVT